MLKRCDTLKIIVGNRLVRVKVILHETIRNDDF